MVEMVKVVDNTKPYISPDDKVYLVCLLDKDTGTKEWEFIKGRMNAYEYIKDYIEYIDFDKSFILAETLTLKDRKSIYAFMKFVSDQIEDSFDINDYIKGDWNEADFIHDNSVANELSIDPTERLNMQDIINGTVETIDKEN